MDRLHLKVGESVLVLAPRHGGAIARLALAGREILRRADDHGPNAANPLNQGEFPMAPWVNRIAKGRFIWGQREIDVSNGPGSDPQGLHGVCWQSRWSIVKSGPSQAVLGMDWNAAEGWPFPFRFTRRFTLTGDQLAIDCSLQNTGDGPMPAALGFHPYFPAAGARLSAATAGAWLTDADGLPALRGLVDVSIRMQDGLTVGEDVLDNCFVEWNGSARIDWPTHAIMMRTEPSLRYLQIYTPAGAGYFCVEPQSAMPDAFNRDPQTGGFVSLGPGAVLSASLYLNRVQGNQESQP